MLIVDRTEAAALLDDKSLVEALREAFREGATVPARHHHTIKVPGAPDATLLLMPAWQQGKVLGVKLANVFPGNTAGKPAVTAAYILFDANDGSPLALIDGGELTARRTAATSVLAATYLARADATRLLVVGTGRIAHHLARVYKACLPDLHGITVWGRNPAHAKTLADNLARASITATPVSDLAQAVRAADIVTCATLSTAPLVKGEWLREGQHIDLIGGFTPAMREADTAAIARARIVVDTFAAVDEAGDLLTPMREGALDRTKIADLAALTKGTAPPRRSPQEVTLFKSVGNALEDLAAATLVWRKKSAGGT